MRILTFVSLFLVAVASLAQAPIPPGLPGDATASGFDLYCGGQSMDFHPAPYCGQYEVVDKPLPLGKDPFGNNSYCAQYVLRDCKNRVLLWSPAPGDRFIVPDDCCDASARCPHCTATTTLGDLWWKMPNSGFSMYDARRTSPKAPASMLTGPLFACTDSSRPTKDKFFRFLGPNGWVATWEPNRRQSSGYKPPGVGWSKTGDDYIIDFSHVNGRQLVVSRECQLVETQHAMSIEEACMAFDGWMASGHPTFCQAFGFHW